MQPDNKKVTWFAEKLDAISASATAAAVLLTGCLATQSNHKNTNEKENKKPTNALFFKINTPFIIKIMQYNVQILE